VPPARIALVLASVAGLGLLLRSLLHVPPPLALALAALVGYLVLVVLGLLRPELGMFADVVTAGPADAHGLALTLDDGPSPRSTPRALESLANAGACATFFVTAAGARAHPDLVRAIVERGHAIGALGPGVGSGPWFSGRRRTKRDLEALLVALADAGIERVRHLRWATRVVTPGACAVAAQRGLYLVASSVGGGPTRGPTRADAADRLVRGLTDGAIVRLALVTSEGTPDAGALASLDAVLDAVGRLQLECVPLADWLGEEPEPASLRGPRRSG